MIKFGWQPVVLTVHEDYYEEENDWNLCKLLPNDLRIEKVRAFRLTRPRIIGDISLRAFFQLLKRSKQLIKNEHFDMVYISIPSFYTALIGRMIFNKTAVRYGIDYIDPWVHDFPGSNKIFSRHWFSKQLSKILEPIAVKKASMITGVSEAYYLPVLERNPHLKANAISGHMPYGAEASDYDAIRTLKQSAFLFQENKKKKFVYAGAMLPKAYQPLEMVFQSIRENKDAYGEIEFYFIGTGYQANNPDSYNIKPLAEKYGIWSSVVFEHPKRISYFDVLVHLIASDGIFILGSTEAHYTPSKIFQAALSKKSIFAILHEASTAVDVIKKANLGKMILFNGQSEVNKIKMEFHQNFIPWVNNLNNFNPDHIAMEVFEQFSAYESTRKLAELMDKVIDKNDIQL